MMGLFIGACGSDDKTPPAGQSSAQVAPGSTGPVITRVTCRVGPPKVSFEGMTVVVVECPK